MLAYKNIILPTLNEIAINQAGPTQETNKKCNILMDYLATHQNTKLRYHSSNMTLHINTDDVCLIATNAKNRVTGYFCLIGLHNKKSTPTPQLNASVHVE